MRVPPLRRVRLLAAAFIAVLALTVLPGAVAADNQTVSLVGCWNLGGGQATVAAGEPIILRAGWGAKTRGLVMDWLHGTHVIATIDGQPLPNADDYYGSPWRDAAGNWWTTWLYDVGTLGPGDSIAVTFNWWLNHRLLDGYAYDPAVHHPTFWGPGWFMWDEDTGLPWAIPCTITAV